MSLTALHDVPAPAKLNLFLHIVGRRSDGYHLLQSVFVLIDWCDVLHFELRRSTALSRQDLGPALPEDDLCLRAARALQAASGSKYGAHIAIDKRVPWGAGLGGGSSDAATTLLALNRLWGLNWSRRQLADLAVTLGADVPFFIGGDNAWVEGIGERLTPVAVPSASYAVLKPALAVPTAAIFSRPDLSRATPAAIVADFLADPFGFGRNDLQEAAIGYEQDAFQAEARSGSHPRTSTAVATESQAGIASALARLSQAFGTSRMSGSGSAVFAHAATPAGMTESTQVFARLLATAPKDWSGRLCQGLTSHPLKSWSRDD